MVNPAPTAEIPQLVDMPVKPKLTLIEGGANEKPAKPKLTLIQGGANVKSVIDKDEYQARVFEITDQISGERKIENDPELMETITRFLEAFGPDEGEILLKEYDLKDQTLLDQCIKVAKEEGVEVAKELIKDKAAFLRDDKNTLDMENRMEKEQLLNQRKKAA